MKKQMDERFNIVLPEEIDKDEYARVTGYLSTIGFLDMVIGESKK